MATDPKIEAWLEAPYQPEMGSGIDVKERIAKASEYTARHVFEINQKLDTLINNTSGIISEVADLSAEMQKKKTLG